MGNFLTRMQEFQPPEEEQDQILGGPPQGFGPIQRHGQQQSQGPGGYGHPGLNYLQAMMQRGGY